MTTIKINDKGPAIVNNPMDGIITVITPDGTQTTTEGKTVALCCCNQSSKKPYCDGSHNPKPPPTKVLRDLAEHNKQVLEDCIPWDTLSSINHSAVAYHKPVGNGFACPECGEEMYDPRPGVVLCSYPGQIEMACPSCGCQTTRYI